MGAGSQFRISGQGGVEVKTLTLQSLVGSHEVVDLLKIDAEGAEYETLPSASRDVLRRIRQIEMEYHPSGEPERLFRRLRDCGFQVTQVHDQGGGYGTASLSNSNLAKERGDE
jgi:hypothetical protein